MQLKEVKGKSLLQESPKAIKEYSILQMLYDELEKKELPADLIEYINQRTDTINSVREQDPKLLKVLKKVKQEIVTQVEKQMKIVPLNYYRNQWTAVGMASFGLPIGALYAILTENWGMMGIGLPIGMMLGMAYGTRLDKKAREEFRQLDLDMNQYNPVNRNK